MIFKFNNVDRSCQASIWEILQGAKEIFASTISLVASSCKQFEEGSLCQ